VKVVASRWSFFVGDVDACLAMLDDFSYLTHDGMNSIRLTIK
jgi:hypothetical protein